jgi:hypothetical protein
MHPICPLSLSHARIFVLADVWSRWKRKQGFSVRFPICMHYSGSTVFKIVSAVSNFLKNQKLSDSEQKTSKLKFSSFVNFLSGLKLKFSGNFTIYLI